MKKIILAVLFIAFVSAGNLFAQTAPLAKGEKQLNFGVGLNDSNGLPVYASLDFAVHKDITVTPGVFMNLDYMNGLGVVVKADYHFNSLLSIPSEFDFYAGLGYSHFFDFDTNSNGGNGIDFQIGGRWYWNSKWGLNLELGGNDLGYGAKFGLSMKL